MLGSMRTQVSRSIATGRKEKKKNDKKTSFPFQTQLNSCKNVKSLTQTSDEESAGEISGSIRMVVNLSIKCSSDVFSVERSKNSLPTRMVNVELRKIEHVAIAQHQLTVYGHQIQRIKKRKPQPLPVDVNSSMLNSGNSERGEPKSICCSSSSILDSRAFCWARSSLI